MQQNPRPILWTIAGSDCSGGAGIQADIKTGHTLGFEVCSLITANTVQNSNNLVSINPTDIEVLEQQYQALRQEKAPTAIKIGMLANNAQLQWLIDTLQKIRPQNAALIVVCDPVIKASVGGNLNSEALDMALYKKLLQSVDLITPNLDEAARLAEDIQKHHSKDDWAKILLDQGCPAVVISGGHGDCKDSITDTLYLPEQSFSLVSPRNNSSYGHGSGCTLSTALTCFLALGYLPRDAFIQAQAYLNKAFALCPEDSDYYGAIIQPQWPLEKEFYPQVKLPESLQTVAPQGFAPLLNNNLGLYPVIDSIEWLKKLLPLGLHIIQLRLKNQTEQQLREQIKHAVELSKFYPQTQLFINDHWQLAIEFGAFGIHLGQEDLQALSAVELQTIQQSGIRLGISTHGAYEFILAQQIRPSYLAIGAIFPTRTKDMSGQIQGLDNLQQLLKLRPHNNMPVVAIGGITLDRAPLVKHTGVESIAVVTAITEATDYKKAVAKFKSICETQ